MDVRTRWDLIEEVTGRLAAAGIATPEVDARWLVDHLAERFGGNFTGCDRGVLDALVDRRAAREPLQLVVGHTIFRWVDLAMRPGVFVPRPETEVVAGVAIDAARSAGTAPRVLEPCTGSGAIACAVASEVPGVQVHATDSSADAVTLARENASRLAATTSPTPWRPGPWPAPAARITIGHGDLFDGFDPACQGTVDVLVANPPYLPATDTDTWEPEVADHDPHAALVGGPDGHEVVDALLAAAPTWLVPGGTVVIEIDDRRGPDAVAAARAAGLVDAHTITDLTGRDRAVVARTREETRS